MVTGSKCLSRSSLSRKVSTVPTVPTLLNGSQSHKAETLLSSVSCGALGWKRVSGTRSALCAGVERDQTLEDHGKVTIDTGVQRELTLAQGFPLCGMKKLLLRTRAQTRLNLAREMQCLQEERRFYGKFDLTTGSIFTNPADAAFSAGCAPAQPFAKAP